MFIRRVRKQFRRYLSDLIIRGIFYFDDFGVIVVGYVSFLDYDVFILIDKELYGFGGLRRVINFSNINNIDVCEKFYSVILQFFLSNVYLQDWESFDEFDVKQLLLLNRKKWDRFFDVYDQIDRGGSDFKSEKEDMWIFIFDSIINVLIGRFRYWFYQYLIL